MFVSKFHYDSQFGRVGSTRMLMLTTRAVNYSTWPAQDFCKGFFFFVFLNESVQVLSAVVALYLRKADIFTADIPKTRYR